MSTFTYTGAAQTYVVPDGVHEIDVSLLGASGKRSTSATYGNVSGGRGATVSGRLAVTPGETLHIFVGGWGFNGGAGNAGGATDIRRGGTALGNRVAVAAGGGAPGGLFGEASTRGKGGDAGYPNGSPGADGSFTTGGTGATQTAGGVAGGALGQGGGGTNGSGGGGGGYYGGGGGRRDAIETWTSPAGGGGGSSYIGGLTGASTGLGPATTSSDYTGSVTITALNNPPNAPTLTSLADGGAINLHAPQRASHVHSDPNGDPQTAFDIRWRPVGASSWTSVYVATTAQWYDIPADTFAPGDHERQVRTYDVSGPGPWSASGFFTAAVVPNTPTITAPANGSTVAEQTVDLTWSTSDQDAYQVRRLADDGTVLHDTGQVTSGSSRAHTLTFDVDGRDEQLQLRILAAGLWSEWATVTVTVDYDTPPVPTFEATFDPATGSVLVSVTNPAAGAGELDADHNEVWVNDGGGWEPRARAVAVDGTWRYWTPPSGFDPGNDIRVVAVAASGTTSN